ncbi:MAG TPA: PD-(D/E)XK nuclease family protein, partial [Candidatus Kryptonia bacterium]|nr:PD-(D/E)XK nuclease family protein [Candidatus Kryptonia bacterium]
MTTRTRRLFVNGSFAVLEAAAVELLRTLKSAGDPLAPLWVVVPTNLLRQQLGRRVAAGQPGHTNLRFLTLLDLAGELAEPPLMMAGASPLSDFAALALVRRLLREQPTDYFAALAERPGLHAAVLATLNDLADGEVDPQTLAEFVRTMSPNAGGADRLAALARLYRAYREELSRLGLYDRNDLLRAAAARAATQRPPDEQIVLYGFYDFTPLQRRLVAAVVGDAAAAMFMPWEDGARFAYATPTLNWLRSLGFVITPLASELPASDLARAQARLFDGGGVEPADASDQTVRVISAPGESREVREVARAILDFVRERGFRFEEIAVLTRAREPYGGELVDCLQRCSIPAYVEGGRPLVETCAGRALLLLLRILQEDFARPAVIEFATAAPIPFAALMTGGERCTPAQWDVLSADAGIVAGRTQWTTRLAALRRRYEEQQSASEEPAPWFGARLAEIDRCLRFVERLADDLEVIGRRGSWRRVVGSLLEVYGRYVQPSEQSERVRRAVASLADLDRVAGDASVSDFTAAIANALAAAHEPIGVFGQGVFVGDIMPARGLSFGATIIPGLVERGMPRPITEDPLLLDDERQYLGEHSGRHVAAKTAGFDEERLLFTLMLRSARAAAVLTYPRLDMATARDRLPSVFLLHLCTALSGRRASYRDFDEWKQVQRVELSRLLPPSLDRAVDGFEVTLARAHAALQRDDRDSLRALLAAPFLQSAWQAEAARASGAFTPYDGVLAGAAALQRLAATEWTLSPRRVQTYLRCPYQFFLEHILKIEALEEPERILTVSPLDRGNLVHGVLYEFYRRAAADALVPLRTATQRRAEALMDEIATARCAELEAGGLTGLPLAWRHQQRVLRETLRRFIAAEIGAADEFVPTYFEYGFGDGDAAVGLRLPAGEVVQLRGRIDRIELSAGGGGRVVDYKTGKPAEVATDTIEPATVQLPFYLHAVRTLFPSRRWQRADLLYVNLEAEFARVGLAADAPAAQAATLAALVAEVLHGIRSGRFTAGGPTCAWCEFEP